MSPTKIVFPPPPPTTNTLTSQQRKQLLRSTKKLGRVLGSTPQLIDDSDVYSSDSSRNLFLGFRDEPYPVSFRRESIDSIESSLASTSTSPITSRSATPTSTLSPSNSSVRSAKSSATSLRSTRSSISKLTTRPPLLRIAFNSSPCLATPSLDTIPSSPLSPSTHISTQSFSEKLAESHAPNTEAPFTIRPTTKASPRDSLIEPDFFIPSQSTLRRQKMDRLRRKLGDDVPLSLVFPQQRLFSDDGEAYVEDEVQVPAKLSSSKVSTSVVKTVAFPPPPTPTSPIVKTSRNTSRDSLTLPSVHRANRSKRVPVPVYDPSLPTTYTTIRIHSPSTPSTICSRTQRHTASISHIPSPNDKSLGAIVECPDEHGSSCGEEFGLFGGPYPSKVGQLHPYASSTSPYIDTPVSVSMKTDVVSVKLWSTRKGYEGWALPAPQI